ncbi:MAG: hypothetical protein AAB257_01760 [Nitrospinota bacterium]
MYVSDAIEILKIMVAKEIKKARELAKKVGRNRKLHALLKEVE